jgi:hypothetical protein
LVEVLGFLSAALSVYVRMDLKNLVSILTLVLIPVSDTGILPAEKITVEHWVSGNRQQNEETDRGNDQHSPSCLKHWAKWGKA